LKHHRRLESALQNEYLASIGEALLPDEIDFQRSADFHKSHREALSAIATILPTPKL
jgi:hypothetical protein